MSAACLASVWICVVMHELALVAATIEEEWVYDLEFLVNCFSDIKSWERNLTFSLTI